jgi:hypothetical protein
MLMDDRDCERPESFWKEACSSLSEWERAMAVLLRDLAESAAPRHEEARYLKQKKQLLLKNA